jgi:hypothetical protein
MVSGIIMPTVQVLYHSVVYGMRMYEKDTNDVER